HLVQSGAERSRLQRALRAQDRDGLIDLVLLRGREPVSSSLLQIAQEIRYVADARDRQQEIGGLIARGSAPRRQQIEKIVLGGRAAGAGRVRRQLRFSVNHGREILNHDTFRGYLTPCNDLG